MRHVLATSTFLLAVATPAGAQPVLELAPHLIFEAQLIDEAGAESL